MIELLNKLSLRRSSGLGSEQLARQLQNPHGIVGAALGRLMDFINRAPNRAAMGALEPISSDRVLELGFGSGAALRQIVRKGPSLVCGLELSSTMVAQAKGRNRGAVVSGRAFLVQGHFKALPYADASFDKVLLVNVAYFFSSGGFEVQELRRVLAPKGCAVIYVTDRATMSRWTFVKHGLHRLFDESELRGLMELGGFRDHEIEIRRLGIGFGVNGLLAVVRKKEQERFEAPEAIR